MIPQHPVDQAYFARRSAAQQGGCAGASALKLEVASAWHPALQLDRHRWPFLTTTDSALGGIEFSTAMRRIGDHVPAAARHVLT